MQKQRVKKGLLTWPQAGGAVGRGGPEAVLGPVLVDGGIVQQAHLVLHLAGAGRVDEEGVAHAHLRGTGGESVCWSVHAAHSSLPPHSMEQAQTRQI